MRTLSLLPVCVLAVLCISTWSACKKNVAGCVDPTALNYNPNATEDNGKCAYLNPEDTITVVIVPGCTDPAADNYNPDANEDDNSCIYLGCTDPTADNYDPDATEDDGSCIDAREKFAGTYAVQSDCAFPFFLAAEQTITFSAGGSDTVWIDPITAVGGTAYGLVSGSALTIPPQDLTIISFSGTGTINAAHTLLSINFDYDAGFLGAGSCTADYAK